MIPRLPRVRSKCFRCLRGEKKIPVAGGFRKRSSPLLPNRRSRRAPLPVYSLVTHARRSRDGRKLNYLFLVYSKSFRSRARGQRKRRLRSRTSPTEVRVFFFCFFVFRSAPFAKRVAATSTAAGRLLIFPRPRGLLV